MFKLITKNADILYNSNNIAWSSDSDTLGTQITFDTIKDLYEGQVVSLYETNNELVRGIIIKKTDKKNTFSYTVQDYSFYLKNKVPIIQFNGETASECIKSLISDAYLVGSISEIPTQITHIYRNMTIADIITDILEKAESDQGKKYIREIEGNKLYIYELQDLKIVPNVVVGDFNIDSSIENMKNDISVISSEEKYNSIVASASDESLYYWYGKLSDTVTVDADNVAQAQNIALNKLSELNKIERSTTIPLVVLDEKVEIKANRLIYLHQGPLVGYYKIKNAKHTLADGLHKCDIEITFDYPHTNVTSQYENTDLINEIISDASKSSSSGSSSSSDVDISNATELSVDLSFYTGAASEGGSESASGKSLEYGMCASNVYPFGTQFKIVGINGLDDGVFTVEDRGGSDFNSASRLDIYVGNGSDAVSKANNLGRQTCTAYRLN